MDGIERNLPYTEESENMVYAVGIAIFRHLAETLLPPLETIFCHDIPVVRGQSPVLPEYREIVRWSAGLTIHVEEARIRPCVGTETAHADRDVSFKHHAVTVGIVSGLTQLTVEVILHEEVVINLLPILIGIRFHFVFIVGGEHGPVVVVRSMVLVTEHTPDRPGKQPVLVGCYKSLIFVGLCSI